jgi:hypothetical protein
MKLLMGVPRTVELKLRLITNRSSPVTTRQ